jgi:hypothetical protein
MIVAMSCNTEKQISLSDDNTIKTVFNSSEINDLLKIQNFFDKSIGLADNKNQTDLIKVYTDFFKLNSEIEKAADLELPIDFKNQKVLYNQLDKTTFDDIWSIGWSMKMNSSDTLKNIELNRSGKYAGFLKSLGDKDSMVNKYYNSLELAGDISPSMISDLVKNYDNYDIKDPKIRLLIAIHYLTLNDKFERKEKF